MMDKMIQSMSLKSILSIREGVLEEATVKRRAEGSGGLSQAKVVWQVPCKQISQSLMARCDSDVPLSRCVVTRCLLSPVPFPVCELLSSKTKAALLLCPQDKTRCLGLKTMAQPG